MEEVDGIILLTLRSLGVPLPETVTHVSQFDANIMLQALGTCLRLLNHAVDLPNKMPSEIGAKYSICSAIASALQELDYTGEVGFDTVLYPNERSTRKLFRWLLEQLPKAESGQDERAGAGVNAYQRNVMESLALAAKRPYVPPPYRHLPLRTPFSSQSGIGALLARAALAAARDRDAAEGAAAAAADEARRRERMQLAVASAMRAAMAAAAAAAADGGSSSPYGRRTVRRGAGNGGGDGERGSRFQHQAGFAEQAETPVVDEGTRQKEREALEADLESRMRALQDEAALTEQQLAELSLTRRQLTANSAALGEQQQKLDQEAGVRRQVLAMASNLEGNMAKLREISQATAARLLQLGAEWEKHRVPLVDAYRRARSEAADAAAALRALSERRDQVREEMRAVIAAAREREERVAQLQAELERLPRDVRRELYTDRILEIIKQVKKQQVDIDKILIEIHQVHKEINAITESLSRSFNATDELIYKEARKGDEQVKQIYRQVIEMNACFQKLVKTVEETGSTLNSARELEQQTEQLASRSNDMAVDRVLQDLAQIRAENQQLLARARG